MPQDQSPFDGDADIHTSDLVSSDMYIDTSGSVIGTFYYVEGFTKFSNDPEEQSGHFFPIQLGDKYTGKTIVVKKNGAERKRAADTSWVLRIEPTDTFTFEVLNDAAKVAQVSAIAEETPEKILTISFDHATFENEVTKVRISNRTESVGYGSKTGKELMDDNVHIEWLDGDVMGIVKGTLHYIDEWTELPGDGEKKGHFFALKIDDAYKDKPFTFIREGEVAGETDKAGSDELFWVLKVDKNKNFSFVSDGQVIAQLSFAETDLEPPLGKKALKEIKEETIFDDQSKILDTGFKLEFNGSDGVSNDVLKAKATGTIMYYQGDDKIPAGDVLPIALGDYFKGQSVLINGVEYPVTDEIYYVFDPDQPKPETLTIQSGKFTIAEIDLKEAKVLPGGEHAVRIAKQDEDMDAVKPASRLIGSNVKIKWEGIVGYVEGTVNPYCFTNDINFKTAPNGHFIPVVLDDAYKEIKITAHSSSGSTAELADPKWIIRANGYIKNKTKAKLAYKNNVFAELDFTRCKFTPATGYACFARYHKNGHEAFPDKFHQDKNYSDFFGDDFKVDWIGGTGFVSGAVKKIDNTNYWMPMYVLEDYAGVKLTAKDTSDNGENPVDFKSDPTNDRVWYLKLGTDPSTIKKRVIEIHREDNDLLLGTFKFPSLGIGKYTGWFGKDNQQESE